MSHKEEIIQISLGSTANSVTAHLLNLQGLACTSSSTDEKTALCNVNKTHEISSQDGENVYTPRIIFVDGRDSFEVRRNRGKGGGGERIMGRQEEIQEQIFGSRQNNASGGGVNEMSDIGGVLGWTPVQQQQQQNNQGEDIFSWDGKIDIFQKPNPQREEIEEEDPVAIFQNAASILSSHTSSRYSAPSRYTSTTLTSNERHMVWDSDEEEESEEDGQSEEMKQYLAHQQHQRQIQLIETASHNLSAAWDTLLSQNNLNDILHWSNYWMYPHPSFSSYALPLPFSTFEENTEIKTVLSSFTAGFNTSSNSMIASVSTGWRREVVSESLRHSLEKCDVLRGINLLVDNGQNADMGFYAGLTASICQELRDECRSAQQFINWIHSTSPTTATDEGTTANSSGENAKKVAKYRRGISQGLSLASLCEYADVVLPLYLPSNITSNFQATGILAAMLECSTLPYRLQSSSSNCIGLSSGYLSGGSGPYETCSSLSFQEYISCLKPSTKHFILELDGLYQPLSSTSSPASQTANSLPSFMQNEESSSLHSKIMQGTSIERQLKQKQEEEWRKQNLTQGNWNSKSRRRMQKMGRTPDVDPGLWLEGMEDHGGLLSSFSPTSSSSVDEKIGGGGVVQRRGRGDVILRKEKQEMKRTRSLHHHFALSASFRPPPPPTSSSLSFASFRKNQSLQKENNAVSTYLTPTMESLGVRYRPEISSSVVIPQSIYDLTSSSVGSAAGMYWPSIFSSPDENNANKSYIPQTPILSILGNTTRSYPFLATVVQDYTFSLSKMNSDIIVRMWWKG